MSIAKALLLVVIYGISNVISIKKLEYSGMTVTNGKYCPNITFDSDVSVTSFEHIRSIGTNFVALIDTQYQKYHNSTEIFPIYGKPQTCNGGILIYNI